MTPNRYYGGCLLGRPRLWGCQMIWVDFLEEEGVLRGGGAGPGASVSLHSIEAAEH